jgi:predicted CoA-binding protein
MNPSVAVVGASPDRRKFGNKSVRAHARAGYDVFPVHPAAAEVEGLPVYKTVADIPRDRLDRVTVYLPAAAGLTFLDTLAGKDIGELWLNPGADDPAVVAKAKQLGLTVVPACSIVALGLSPSQFPDE